MSEEIKEGSKHWIRIGDYHMWEFDKYMFGLTHVETGEAGVFPKSEFLPYVEAFFGLNYD